MFGWEFPPHITGGLGTACYGLTKGLLTHGAEVLFVVPKTFGDEDQSVARIVNASDVKLSFTEENKKVMHHNHITGEYISSICNKCNLQFKYINKKAFKI